MTRRGLRKLANVVNFASCPVSSFLIQMSCCATDGRLNERDNENATSEEKGLADSCDLHFVETQSIRASISSAVFSEFTSSTEGRLVIAWTFSSIR